MNNNDFGEEGHDARTPTEMFYDRISKDAYNKYDKMLDDALEEYENESSLSEKEIRAVRNIIGWQERLLVWLIRITFFLLMYLLFHIKFKEYDDAVKRIERLESTIQTTSVEEP